MKVYHISKRELHCASQRNQPAIRLRLWVSNGPSGSRVPSLVHSHSRSFASADGGQSRAPKSGASREIPAASLHLPGRGLQPADVTIDQRRELVLQFGLARQGRALELAAAHINVNAICPGVIVETGMRDRAEAELKAMGLPSAAERVSAIALGRLGKPDDVARVAAFLASDEAAYMTGQSINVTGGLWLS